MAGCCSLPDRSYALLGIDQGEEAMPGTVCAECAMEQRRSRLEYEHRQRSQQYALEEAERGLKEALIREA